MSHEALESWCNRECSGVFVDGSIRRSGLWGGDLHQGPIGRRNSFECLSWRLLTGYSEFNGIVTGTAIGSFKVLSDREVMLGGDVNNDRKSGLFPGKFNATINVAEMTGTATGFLFYTDGTNASLIPFESPLFPCGDTPGQPANWGAFFER